MLPQSVRILVCTEPQDLRASFDGLALAARRALGEDPQSGALLVFVNKRVNRVKILWWDETGYCILYKRMHRAVVQLPDRRDGSVSVQIDGPALANLLRGISRERTLLGAKRRECA
jgi:transposase